MFFWRLKRTAKMVCATVITLGVFALVRVVNVDKFGGYVGERTYYLDSASSQSLQTDALKGLQFLRVRGESVFLEESVDEAFLESVLRSYDASVLWIEETDGIVSYYCYTPCFEEGVHINGRKVNLHIATDNRRVVIGSPIIFGGF
ncbi:MAG: hypothetical protein E7368_03660 [Clostridiales bacterium]|nr:hypothetical protein [Clostridiales bacterium]